MKDSSDRNAADLALARCKAKAAAMLSEYEKGYGKWKGCAMFIRDMEDVREEALDGGGYD